MKKIIMIILSNLALCNLFSQDSLKLKLYLDKYLEYHCDKLKNDPEFPKDSAYYYNQSVIYMYREATVNHFIKHLNSENKCYHDMAVMEIFNMANDRNTSDKIRFRVIESLASSLNTCKTTNAVTNTLIKGRQFFFTSNARDTIRNYFIRTDITNKRVLKRQSRGILYLLGFLELKEFIPLMDTITQNKRYNKDLRYYAHVAKARMGVKESMNFVLEDYKNRDVDERYRDMNILAFVKQRETVDILIEKLNSDEEMPWHDDKTIGIPYWERALYFLTKSIKDFPVKPRFIKRYTEKDRSKAQNWLKKNSDYELFRDVGWTEED